MLKANYTHFVPEAKENLDYDKHLNYVLIKDFEDLKEKLHLENEIVAWDTETSSLSPQEGDIVGFSWSIDGITGYYCPVDHIDCKIEGSIEYFVSELKKARLSLLYNARFDIRMVEWHLKKCRSSENLSFMRNKFIDVMNAVWIADTNYTLPSLKWATRHFLGYQPPKFLETLGDETNFHFVKVKDAFTYAALDAINTFNVFKVCQCYHNEAGIASYLDTQASWIIGHLEETPLKLNTEKIKKIMADVKEDLDKIEHSIYELAGEKFNIRSNRELTKIFLKLGIDTGERTKAGDMKTSKTLLGSYLERYPDTIILKKIIDYKETFKFYNSYLKTLVEIGDNQNEKPIRFSYKLQTADTTRLSCCDKNTIIYTNHGIKKIVELNNGDKVDDGTGKFYSANLLNMGKKMLYEVRFSDGTSSHLTNDHKLLTVGENGYVWKELKDIEINKDKICVKYNNWRREETDELFYLYVVLSYKSKIVGEKKLLIESARYGKELYDKVTKVLRKYDIQYDNAKTAMKPNHYNKKDASEYKILISGDNYDKLVQLFSDNYSVNAKSDIFDVFKPDIRLINSIQKAETFLECVNDVKIYKHSDKNIQHEFISDNQDILKDIKTVLSFVGVSSEPIRLVLDKYKERKDMDGKYLFNTTSAIFYKYMFDSNYRVGSYPSVKAPQFIKKYILNHPIINYKLWRNEAGKRVLRRFEQTPNFNYCVNFNEEFELGLDIFYYITVDSIEEYKIDDTYTLSVDSDKHRYMSDSFISHNCGKDGKNPFFSKLNLQSIPKPKSCKSYGRRATKEEIENKEDLLGWIFSPDHPEWSPGVCVEGMSLNKNVRDAFIPENGSDDYLVSIDMCTEGGSPVYSKRGYIGISELKIGDEVLTPNGYKKVIRVLNTGKKKVKKINMVDGGQALYCSEDHPIMIDGNKIEAREINFKLEQNDKISSYNKNIEEREYNRESLLCLNNIKSLKDKAKYILENNLLDLFKNSLNLYPRNEVSRWCGIDTFSFSHLLEYLGIETNTNKGFKFKSSKFYNNPFIECTPTSAYLLGYILGNGCITERRSGYFNLSITSTDKTHLNRIASIFGSDVDIKVRKKQNNTWYIISIPDQEICRSLLDLGIRINKSYVGGSVPFGWLNENYRHFLRGLFDSDGSVRHISGLELKIYGNPTYINEIFNDRKNKWIINNRDKYLFWVTLKGNREEKKYIYDYFYKDATLWLQRKRDIIDEWYIKNFGDIEMEMWDITIDSDEHIYYLNNVLSHNCAEEARIVTNLFKEQYFADIINSGGDIHHENSNRIFGPENYTKETRKKAKCISGDSKVFTSMGIKKVSDLISSRNIGVPVKTDFMISTPEGVSNCNGVVYNGKKETLKFTLEDESILEVTPDHLLRSNNKWIKAEDIKINDKIDLTLCPIDVNGEQEISFDNFIPGTKIPFNEELAYLTGAILGDGCVDRKVVRYYSEDTELKSYIEYISKKYSLYKKYASDNELEVSRTYNSGKGKSGKDYERLIVGARKCVELMKAIGIADDNYHKIFRVPEIVNNSPIKVKFAFLQGLFDTDGYVSSQSKGCIAIHLATAHKTLGNDCVTLLRSIGIISGIRTEYSKQWNKDYYKVKITAFSSKLFYEYGGFKCVKKQERLKEWYDSENTGKKCYVTGYKVVDVKHSESEVFDLSVNNSSHSFLVNGFVVHNCALFGMLYGQGERGFQQKFPYMTIEEAKDFLDTFKTLIPNIVRGQARMTREARKTGTFKTTFGHSIRVKSYLTSSNYKDKAFGERKIKNCYSPDTEFLTLEGWKYAKYITPITQIAYYDPKTNLIRFTSAGERLTNICTESVKYESKVASWNVTKNHNMWIRDSRNDNWRFIEAEKLVNKKVFEELASCRDLCEDLLEIGEVETPIGKYSRYDLAKLFGWLITNSSINHLNHIIITQTKEENFNEIINTVKKFNGTFTIKNKNPYKSGKILYARICRNEFVKWCIEQMGGKLKKDRNIPKFILNSDISVRDAFIHSVINGDGNRRIDRNSVRVWHCSRKFINAFQSLLIYSGYRCSYKEYKGKKGQSLYSINIIESDIKSMDTRTNKYGRSNISIVKHEPMEFSCFNVPTHILITRHNGKVSFHGNSPIQGCAAEVLKLEFVRLWDNVFTKYPEIKFHSTIHDEINFSVPRRLADEVIPIMIKCMTVKMEDWIVPLDCSLSVGYTMGTLIPFKYNFETKEFIPDWEELVEKKDTKEVQEDEEENDEYMDDIEDGYEDSDFDI